MDYIFTRSENSVGAILRPSVPTEDVPESVLTDLVDLQGQLFYSDFKEPENKRNGTTTRFGSLLFYVVPQLDNLAQLTIENIHWEDSTCRLLHFDSLEYCFDGFQKQLRSVSFSSQALPTASLPVLSITLTGHLRHRCGLEEPFVHTIQLQVGVDKGW